MLWSGADLPLPAPAMACCVLAGGGAEPPTRQDPAEIGVHRGRLAIRPVGVDGPRGGSPLLRRIRAARAPSPTREPMALATISAGGRAAVQEPASGRHSVRRATSSIANRGCGASLWTPRPSACRSRAAGGSPCGALTRPRSTHPSCTDASTRTSPTAQCGSSCRHRRIARRLQIGGRAAEHLDQQTRAQAEAAPPDCSDIDNKDIDNKSVRG